MYQSKIHSHVASTVSKPLVITAQQVGDAAVAELNQLGIAIDPAFVHEQVRGLYRQEMSFGGQGADAAPAAMTSPSIPTPVQFLQAWLPGFVKVITAARKIDQLVGITTIGSWSDAEIVQGIMEPYTQAMEYGDTTNVPLTSYNVNFERRHIVRGELGLSVGELEDARGSAIRVNVAAEKRSNVALGLELFRNSVGFYGWSSAGMNRTFGFLNDPNLPSFGTLPSAKTWDQANFQEMTKDIRTMVAALRIKSQDQIDPESVDLILALPTSKVDHITTTTDYGISVRDWIKQTYPRMQVVSIPELQNASQNADAVYLYAEKVDSSIDGSTDGGQTFMQLVPQKMRTLGVERRIKSYTEAMSNALGGVLCKRPYAVVRYTGL